jgi:hypothetical protein
MDTLLVLLLLVPAASTFQAMVFVIKAQANLVLRSLPTVGWLMVGLRWRC